MNDSAVLCFDVLSVTRCMLTGQDQYSADVGSNDGHHVSKNSSSHSNSSNSSSKHNADHTTTNADFNETAIGDIGGAPGEVNELIYDDR
jgi:hypothetical protein